MKHFHVLSFEGPDKYARVGGLATRIEGLTQTLADHGLPTDLWFVGDPDLPGHEDRGNLHLHRWCQWISRHCPNTVYDGDAQKAADYAASLPPYLMDHVLGPQLAQGGHAVILAEEWQTVDAVLHLDWLLRRAGLRDQVGIFWNANNTFGFEGINWQLLGRAACITTVSRYMNHKMRHWGIDPVVIPNGLTDDAFWLPERAAVAKMQRRLSDRTVVTKMARWDPDKRWLASVRLVAELKRQGWKPLLVARGGSEAHGADVLAEAQARGLKIVDRENAPGVMGVLGMLETLDDADVVNLKNHVDPDGRRLLFRGSDAVLANSSHEPFGLVGLETMAASGIACTGFSGEDYVLAGRNALVLQTDAPQEFISLYTRLRGNREEVSNMRRLGRSTAKHYAWSHVVARDLMPRLELPRSHRDPDHSGDAGGAAFGHAAQAA